MIKENNQYSLLIGMMILLVIISIAIMASVPPISRDALIHHLEIPKLYIEKGGIYEIPSLDFSYYPMNLDYLFLIALFFGNDIVPKYIHFAFAILTSWLIFQYLKEKINPFYASIGVLLFISIPIIVRLSTTAYVDLGLIFFSTASLLYLLKWMENDFRLRFLIISAVMCGFALGTKYNGLITLFVVTAFTPLIYIRCSDEKSNLRAIFYGIAFCLIALTVFSPWMIKNYMWTGNPIYPLYNEIFNPPLGAPEEGTSINHFVYRHINYNESYFDILSVPLRIFFEGRDNEPQNFDGKLNPLLLFLPFFAFFLNHQSRLKIEKRVFLMFAILYFFIAFFQTTIRIRYIAPIIPPLVILSIFGLNGIFRRISLLQNTVIRKMMSLTVGITIVALFLVNGVYLQNLWKKIDPIPYLRGSMTRDAYLNEHLKEYASIQYANESLDEDAVILAIFMGNRGYYSERKILFDHNLLFNDLKNINDPDKIRDRLTSKEITHLIINYYFFSKWTDDNFRENSQRIMHDFIQTHLELLFSENGYGVFAILTRN